MSKFTDSWASQDLDARIAAHIRAWEQAKKVGDLRPLEAKPFVTISREFGCESEPVARTLTQLLNERHPSAKPWVAYDRQLLDRVASELNLQRELLDGLDNRRRDEMTELFEALLNRNVDEVVVFRKLAEIIRSLAMHGHAVLVGRGSYRITRDLKTGLHVRLVAPREWRRQKIVRIHHVTLNEAEQILAQGERERARFLETFFVRDAEGIYNFDMVLNNARLMPNQIAEIIYTVLKLRFGAESLAA